jgi:hypothetical protein
MTQGIQLTSALRRVVGALDDAFDKDYQPVSTLLASWSDELYTTGHFGVWGSYSRLERGREPFRLLNVKVHS